MAHPLTDEICRQIAPFSELWSPTVECNDMRSAADWQLEQVIAHILAAEWFALPEKRISELQQAMRPQQQENN